IVDDVGEVVSRDAVNLQENDVEVILRHRDRTLDAVIPDDPFIMVTGGSKPDYKRISLPQLFQSLFKREMPAFGPLSVVTGARHLLFFLNISQVFKILLRAKTRIGRPAPHELRGKSLINFNAIGLQIRTVFTLLYY